MIYTLHHTYISFVRKFPFTLRSTYNLNTTVPRHTANQYFLCPPTDEAIIQESPCPTSCIDDTQCQINSSDSLCCPTSDCGQQCVRALRVPYHHPILHCPEPDPDTVGACAEICASDTDCTTEGERCCSNGCGHGCTTAEKVTPVCRGIVESHNGTVRPGEYVPQCEDDGSFSQAQNHASTGYWWCVRPDTGEPVGREMVKFTQPQCYSEPFSVFVCVCSTYMYIHMCIPANC